MILDGKMLKNKILEEIKTSVMALSEPPTLCVIQVGDDAASNVYIKQKENMCKAVGYRFISEKFPENVSEEELITKINQFNQNPEIHAILVQTPLPNGLSTKKILNQVSAQKDVDGLTDYNKIQMLNHTPLLIPCTAMGIITLLDEYHVPLAGSDIVIVGRSDLVGMPLFHLLENRDATVTLCHSKTKNLKEKTSQADILIIAVGKKSLITADMIKQDAVVIDVGINRENNILYGDVDFDQAKNKASLITPVPGGVGPMTIASLARNILIAYQIQKGI